MNLFNYWVYWLSIIFVLFTFCFSFLILIFPETDLHIRKFLNISIFLNIFGLIWIVGASIVTDTAVSFPRFFSIIILVSLVIAKILVRSRISGFFAMLAALLTIAEAFLVFKLYPTRQLADVPSILLFQTFRDLALLKVRIWSNFLFYLVPLTCLALSIYNFFVKTIRKKRYFLYALVSSVLIVLVCFLHDFFLVNKILVHASEKDNLSLAGKFYYTQSEVNLWEGFIGSLQKPVRLTTKTDYDGIINQAVSKSGRYVASVYYSQELNSSNDPEKKYNSVERENLKVLDRSNGQENLVYSTDHIESLKWSDRDDLAVATKSELMIFDSQGELINKITATLPRNGLEMASWSNNSIIYPNVTKTSDRKNISFEINLLTKNKAINLAQFKSTEPNENLLGLSKLDNDNVLIKTSAGKKSCDKDDSCSLVVYSLNISSGKIAKIKNIKLGMTSTVSPDLNFFETCSPDLIFCYIQKRDQSKVIQIKKQNNYFNCSAFWVDFSHVALMNENNIVIYSTEGGKQEIFDENGNLVQVNLSTKQ